MLDICFIVMYILTIWFISIFEERMKSNYYSYAEVGKLKRKKNGMTEYVDDTKPSDLEKNNFISLAHLYIENENNKDIVMYCKDEILS